MKYHYQEALSLNGVGTFEGYAAIFSTIDNMGDVILPGAFSGCDKDVKLLWQHEHDTPIGLITNIYEDVKGLKITGQFLLDISKAREAYSLVKNGVLRGLSIGYRIIDYITDDTLRYLKKVDLLEISLVTFPANVDAQIHSVKSDDISQLFVSLSRAINTIN